MSEYKAMVRVSNIRTKILLLDGEDEILRSVLPPPTHIKNRRAAATLLEGLALWLDRPLRVVVSAEELEDSWSLGLIDDVGVGERSIFYTVEVIEKPTRRRRKSLGGVDDFRDVRQMVLLGGGRR
jgi:hypothetical protein